METSEDVQKSLCVCGVQKTNMLKSDYQIRLLIKMGMLSVCVCVSARAHVCVCFMSNQVTQLLYDFTVALHHAEIIL